jgi:CrcB protein
MRYLVGGWAQQKWGSTFPYGTFVINVSGSFILSLFAALALQFGWIDEWRLFFAVGFVGAYTTFSTFEFESLQYLVHGDRWNLALTNLVGSVVAGFLAAYLGLVLARLILHGRS